MKYIYTLFTIAAFATAILLMTPKTAQTSASGPVTGVSGSIPENGGATCVQGGCHGGSVTPRANIITSDVPASGYVPGSTYNITATLAEAGISKFGFQVSPQFQNGAKAGTLTPADGNTQVQGAGKYIAHTLGGTSGINTKTWTFSWTAPAANSGPVTFYGAFMASNNNGLNDGGDNVFTSSMGISEAGHLGINGFANAGMCIYPVPFDNSLTIARGTSSVETATVKIYTLTGQLVFQSVMNADKLEINTSSLAKGIYIVNLDAGNVKVFEKVAK
ncbi:MAG TPA: choice-of-anchor V domain-containing protein [Bacteroidia bacterium]|nr:choice-of-anchor V domain-containing protein [Bacteroidia bacterium]